MEEREDDGYDGRTMIQNLSWLLLAVMQTAPTADAAPPPTTASAPAPEVRGRRVDTGEVTLSCLISEEGHTTDCQILSERPSGAGLGAEALRAIRGARVRNMSEARRAARRSERASFTIRFQTED